MFFWRTLTRSKPVLSPIEKLMEELSHLRLTDDIKVGEVKALGGHADVYDGTLWTYETNEHQKVAIKKFRILLNEEENVVKAFSRELLIWSQLKHENVLPFLGIMVMDGFPCMVSSWMENGTMNKYLRTHKDVNVLELVYGIACGLAYLHRRGVVHSDLKGENVLISRDGGAVLSDFGTSRLLRNDLTIEGTKTFKGSVRWSAPELFQPTDEPLDHLFHTKASDVWALGMVIYEALFRELPFHTCRSEGQVISSIAKGELPMKLDAIGPGEDDFELLWDCCQRCWSYDPTDRPTVAELKARAMRKTFLVESVDTSGSLCWMSPTGRFLASRPDDRETISFWETATMSRCGPDLRMESKIHSIVWSSAEDYIVAVADDGILQKWSKFFESARIDIQSAQRHEKARLKYSPDDSFIVSVGGGTAKLWDALNLSLVWSFLGDKYTVSFHPLGQKIFFFDRDSAFDIDIANRKNIAATKRKLNYWVQRVVYDPSGQSCVVATDEGIKIFSAGSSDEVKILPYTRCKAMRYTADGKFILFILRAKKAVLWDVAAGEVIEELDLDVYFSDYWEAEISKCCRVVCLRNYHLNKSLTVHLTTTRY